MDHSNSFIINPLVDFSEDFVGDFDPNVLSLEDVDNLLNTGMDVTDHQTLKSYHETKTNVTSARIQPRFGNVSNVDAMVEESIPIATRRRNKWAREIFLSWYEEKKTEIHMHNRLEEYTIDDVNTQLSKFIIEVRKKDGKLYPRQSLISIAAGLQYQLRKGRPEIDLFKSPETKKFRDSLDTSMRISTSKIAPTKSDYHDPVSCFDEQKIMQAGVLNDDNPEGLTRKLFYLNGVHFALRGGAEQTNLMLKQFRTEVRNGSKCLIYTPMTGKTCNGGLKDSRASASERMFFEDDDDRFCHVKLFEKYQALVPPDADRFYLYPAKNWNSSPYWYTKRPLGKNTICKMMKNICKTAGINERTNHSLRATCATRMYEGKIDEQVIMERTGHRSVMGVRVYKKTSDILIKDSQVTLHQQNSKKVKMSSCDPHQNQFEASVFGNMYFSHCNVTNNIYSSRDTV